MRITKTKAQWKVVFDSRGYLHELFNDEYKNSADFVIEEVKNQQEDILVYQWIGQEWVLIQCYEAKLTDLFASVFTSHLLESEFQRNSKNHPKDVQHLGIFVRPAESSYKYSKKTEWDVLTTTVSIMQKFPWARFSFHINNGLALKKIARWIKHPPVPSDCGIPVLDVEGDKNIITGMAALMNGMTTELATFCIMKIKKDYAVKNVSLKDLTNVSYFAWESWFKERANRNQKVMAKKWYIIMNGVKIFMDMNEEI